MRSIPASPFDAAGAPASKYSMAGAFVVIALSRCGNIRRLASSGSIFFMDLVTLAHTFTIHLGSITTLGIDRCSIYVVISDIGYIAIINLGSYGRTIGIYLPCP